jgi:hypothetical protein
VKKKRKKKEIDINFLRVSIHISKGGKKREKKRGGGESSDYHS